MTCGIHLIWTTYGTWLPGDSRGHWSSLFDLYGNIIEKGGKLNLSDSVTRKRSLDRMLEPPKYLDVDEIEIVANELSRHVGEPPAPLAWAATIESHASARGAGR